MMEVDGDEQAPSASAVGGSCDPEPHVSPAPPPYFAQNHSRLECQQTSKETTKQAVESLVGSEEYKQLSNTCTRACWYLNHWSMECEECGGHALVRPCPICSGKCGQVWRRDAEMSKSNKSAFWSGSCSLPHAEQVAYYYRTFVDCEEETLLSGMEDLSAR